MKPISVLRRLDILRDRVTGYAPRAIGDIEVLEVDVRAACAVLRNAGQIAQGAQDLQELGVEVDFPGCIQGMGRLLASTLSILEGAVPRGPAGLPGGEGDGSGGSYETMVADSRESGSVEGR